MGVVIIILNQFWQPNQRGCFEDDQTLAYPYHGDTIPFNYLLGVGIIIPCFLILLHNFLNGQRGLNSGWKNNFAILALPTLIGYLFGAASSQLITGIKFDHGAIHE